MLRIRTLGGLRVELDGEPVAGSAAQPRRLAILAVLARAGRRGVLRERLLALLWPDADEEASRGILNQALYALRRDLGSSDAISGMRDLRLEPSIITCDATDFEELAASGDHERAVALYEGAFLDGFRLPGTPEFDRWVEGERAALAQRHVELIERLARDATTRGDATAAINWWRRLAGLDPLNARVTTELMRALATAGDRAGALQQARIYEALLEEHLDLAPDKDVVALARTLRDDPAAFAPAVSRAPARPPASQEPSPPASTPARAPVDRAVSPPLHADAGPASAGEAGGAQSRAGRRWRAVAVIGGVAALGAAAVIAMLAHRNRPSPTASPVLAIGRIADYRGKPEDDIAASLADMLATNLARAPSLRVVSSARMLEMLARAQTGNDTAAGYARAARLAGANQVIEGTIVALSDGGFRLDLRRVSIADGTIQDAQTVRGADLFALADSGSAHLLAAFGHGPVLGSIADVTTRSLTAYRLYTRALTRFQAGDVRAARALFDAALGEDSTFAMAAYWAAVSIGVDWRSPERRAMLAYLDRAVRLSGGVSDRERLVIRTWWARATTSPALRAIADTLSVRYPEEIDGHVQAGAAAILAGDFLGAVAPLERAIHLDSLVLSAGAERCGGCDAFDLLVRAWVAADSVPAAERVARRAVRIWPSSTIPLVLLAEVLDYQGRFDAAESMIASAAEHLPESTVNAWARHWLRTGRFDRLDTMIRERMASDGPQPTLLFWSALSLRNQRRFDEALQVARRFRKAAGEAGDARGSAPLSASVEAQVLLESGKARASAALFDSISAWRLDGQPEANLAVGKVWQLTQAASGLAAAGDRVALASLAETVAVVGARSYSERDRRLHHHVRGLEAMLRNDVLAAIDHFQRAMYSTTIGYNRTNYELAKALLAADRPREAIAVLRPAASGVVIEGANLHLSLADVHALLARAYAAAGEMDSARVHAAWGTSGTRPDAAATKVR